MKIQFSLCVLTLLFSFNNWGRDSIRIGSKTFTESFLLAEIMAQLVEKELKIPVERKFGLGGSTMAFEALAKGELDIYPEYSGTALKVLLKTNETLSFEEMNERFRKNYRVEWSQPFGFNNSYALAMREGHAKKLNIRKYSDLSRHPELRWLFSYEFLNREDGWPALKAFYGFEPLHLPKTIEPILRYEAIRSKAADIIDPYTTDAKTESYHLLVLEDDRNFFPKYYGAPLVSSATLKKYPKLASVLNQLAGKLPDDKMRSLNAAVEIDGKSIEQVAADFLRETGGADVVAGQMWPKLGVRTLQHLKLVFISVFFASLIGIPLGILIRRVRWLTAPILNMAGVAQTIPSIALLALMIPLFGIGEVPALVALFIYGLLPIVRNTYVGLKEIPPPILEAADGIGLRPFKKLGFVELPLAAPTILAGVKTSAVINVGTATLAAFIGAGGLGEPIVTGLALHNTGLILQGAIPAALLAILVESSLSLLEKGFSWKRAL